jgi:hypothetical protein
LEIDNPQNCKRLLDLCAKCVEPRHKPTADFAMLVFILTDYSFRPRVYCWGKSPLVRYHVWTSTSSDKQGLLHSGILLSIHKILHQALAVRFHGFVLDSDMTRALVCPASPPETWSLTGQSKS